MDTATYPTEAKPSRISLNNWRGEAELIIFKYKTKPKAEFYIFGILSLQRYVTLLYCAFRRPLLTLNHDHTLNKIYKILSKILSNLPI